MVEAVAIYTLTGSFVGYTIRDPSKPKLQTTNVYTEQEQEQLAKRLAELNDGQQVRTAWPDTRDPEVQKLLHDRNFEPIEMEEQQVIDEEESFLVWIQQPETDEWGNETGVMVDGTDIDMNASVIVYKIAVVPKRPSDVGERTRKAQEIVARSRMA
jgi:hypothetical protein